MEKTGTLTVTIFRSRSKLLKQVWRWKAETDNGRNVGNSGEGYRDRFNAIDMAHTLLEGANYQEVIFILED